MAISHSIREIMQKGSWIRQMFEEGARLKALHGAENVFDFIFHFCGLDKPNIGMIRLNKLSHSTRYRLPENDAGETDTVEA